MIIGVTGTYCAGKDVAADYLKEKGFTYHSCSDLLRDECKKIGIESTRNNLIKLANRMRAEQGNGILAKMLVERIQKNNEEKALVVSIRHPDEVKELKKNPDFRLIIVDAPIELRFQRSQERKGRPEDRDTFEEFKKHEEFERKGSGAQQQLDAVAALADYTLMNEGTLEELYKKIDEVLEDVEVRQKG